MLKNFLGQPVHPMLVHFPIAFLILSTFLLGLHLLDASRGRVNSGFAKIRMGNFDFESFSFFALFGGVAMGTLAILSGLALVEGWKNLPIPHGPLGLALESCYGVLLLMRWILGQSLYERRLRYLYYSLHFVGILLIGLTGFEGGELHHQ